MYFSLNKPSGPRLLAWHQAMWGSPPILKPGFDVELPDLGFFMAAGERAELRRCAAPADVAFCAAFSALVRAVAPEPNKRAQLLENRFELAGLCRVALVGAQICTADLKKLFAHQAAQCREKTNRPRVSADRWTTFVRQPDPDEALVLLLRILPLVGDAANLIDIANAVANWDDHIRRNLALAYFNPPAENQTTGEIE